MFRILIIFIGGAIALCSSACQKTADKPFKIENPRAVLITQSCSECHSPENEVIPPITGMSPQALTDALMRYKQDGDGQTVMHRLMRGYSKDDIDSMAAALGDLNE